MKVLLRWQSFQSWLSSFYNHSAFQTLIALVILCNFVLYAFEMELQPGLHTRAQSERDRERESKVRA